MTKKSFTTLSAPILADADRRARVEQHRRAILDALALAELREARAVTQQQLAEHLSVTQANISRIEHQDDLYLSTLRGYIEALGGHLEVLAVFPDETIRLTASATD